MSKPKIWCRTCRESKALDTSSPVRSRRRLKGQTANFPLGRSATVSNLLDTADWPTSPAIRAQRTDYSVRSAHNPRQAQVGDPSRPPLKEVRAVQDERSPLEHQLRRFAGCPSADPASGEGPDALRFPLSESPGMRSGTRHGGWANDGPRRGMSCAIERAGGPLGVSACPPSHQAARWPVLLDHAAGLPRRAGCACR